MNKLWVILLSFIIFSCTSTKETGSSSYYSFDDALETGTNKIYNDLPESAKVAILAFKSDSENLSSYIVEEMYDKLINFGMTVLERSFTETIAMEVGYQFSGEVNDMEIVSIGNQLGANYVVTGQITFSGEAYRLRVFAINIEKGQRAASSSLNISSNDRQINHFISMRTKKNIEENTENAGNKIIVLNDTLQIRQSSNIIGKHGGNYYRIVNGAFDILLPNEKNEPVLIFACSGNPGSGVYDKGGTRYIKYDLPLDYRKLFPEGYTGSVSLSPEEQDLFVGGYNSLSWHNMFSDKVTIDTVTRMTRIHFRSIVFSATVPTKLISMIIYVDYNTNKMIEESEIMYLVLEIN